ncbi:hypothetical protein IW261DRAFT_1455237 [Armillaria novae-zelandiae]|uniref:BTB domain-containing protein n=1 Tax=Armillaria novae-zelandiae TaxID=153914 RepID=A0AA39TFN5_9AGAR|nr:hypothetical protein IW261DRAFT_1455237 [Armillaria novae-zelandiae]
MIAMPPSPVAGDPLSRSPSRRGRSKNRSPINSYRSSSESVVVLRSRAHSEVSRSRSRSVSRSSSPSYIPPICVSTPLPVHCPGPPPSMVTIVPCASSVSSRSRPVSRSSRSFPLGVAPIRWAPITVLHHPRFYFQDGNVTLEIERMGNYTIQYKIHRHFLVMSSSVFAEELPPSVIFKYLPSDVDQQAFELVLSLFYPRDCFSGHDIQSESDWHKVLIFACRYKMTVIRDMALTKVPSLDPIVLKAELAAKYGLKDWLVPAYTDLCIKDLTTRKGWSADEGRKIGLDGLLALVDLKQDIMVRLGEYLDREKVAKTVEEKLKGLNMI